GSQPSSKGPAEYFTGTLRIDPLFQAHAPARAVGASVTFEPGARTAWHTHPLGQTLIVTAGCGRVQRWGGPIEEIRPGDVIWVPPGEKHWHGAAPTTAMTHIALQEQLDGKTVDWLEQVSDEQYQAFSGSNKSKGQTDIMASVTQLKCSSPEAEGIPSSAVLDFIRAVEQHTYPLDAVQGFMLLRHGNVAAEGWWTPYGPQSPHSLYSLSKSFTSTGIGLAVAEGLLTVDDPVLKFFPDDTPANPSENL